VRAISTSLFYVNVLDTSKSQLFLYIVNFDFSSPSTITVQ